MRLLLCCLLLCVGLDAVSLAKPSHPNVILIYTDDQGFGDASCLNPESKFSTRNLDRLAQEGVSFTDAHCSDTVCTPSRYGLLTGRYSWRTTLKRGVFGAEKECLIRDGRVTIASLLRERGYRTAMVGKWHLGMDFPGDKGSRDWSQPVQDMPLDKGFDYFYGIPASMNYGVLAWFEGRHAKVPPVLFTAKKPNAIAINDYRMMPPFQRTAKQTQETLGKPGLETAADFVDSECLTRFTDKAIDWMAEHVLKNREESRERQPFFLYLPYTSPHKPVIPRPPFRGQSDAGAYGDFMLETDHHVGRILGFLDQHALAHDTLVIFTSDNGPETTWRERQRRFQHQSNHVYREGKRSIYEGGHRVPFFVRWPGGIKDPGRTWDRPICQTDVLATLAELTRSRLPDDAGEDSQSFLDVLRGNGGPVDRSPIVHHAANGRFAIRDGDWKLVVQHGQVKRDELYNLVRDPRESADMAVEHPEVVERLKSKLTEIVCRGRTIDGPPQPNDTGYWSDLSWMGRDEFVATVRRFQQLARP